MKRVACMDLKDGSLKVTNGKKYGEIFVKIVKIRVSVQRFEIHRKFK